MGRVPWDDNLDAFLDWFIAPENEDQLELRSALRSVPGDRLEEVLARLLARLNEEIEKLFSDSIPRGEDLAVYGLLELKKRMVMDEQQRRAG